MSNDTPATEAEIEPADDAFARERLAKTPAPVSQDSAEKQLRAEIQEHVLRCVDDNQNTLDSMEDSVVSLCREYAARLAPQDSAPRAMPPEVAARLVTIAENAAARAGQVDESELHARVAAGRKVFSAMPPVLARLVYSIRHRMRNLGLGVSPDEVVWLLDALEAAYAPRDESAAPPVQGA